MQLSEINHFYLHVLKQLWQGWVGGVYTIYYSEILYCCPPGHYSNMACLLNHYLLILETEGDCLIQKKDHPNKVLLWLLLQNIQLWF